jgi:hypothetical protein
VRTTWGLECYKNVTPFHDCRKFVVESRIVPDVSK